ncbi:MAG: FkbM family methyltransferase [Cyanobacteria bacterium J06633_8]
MKTISMPAPLTWIQLVDFPHKLGICEKFFAKAIAIKGICWVQTGAGIPWKLDLTNPTHRWIVYGKYEGAAFLNWANKFLPSDGIIVDSGANIGQMLMYLSQMVPQGKVFAFEPGTKAVKWLEECLDIHPGLPVEIIRAGLGASQVQLRLKHAGTSLKHGAQNQISETEGEKIQVVRLASELATRSITKVDLWKLDVEGYEVQALKGAEELLKEQRIQAIWAELCGENGQQVREYLAKYKYYCHFLTKAGKPYVASKFPDHTNGLFLPLQASV